MRGRATIAICMATGLCAAPASALANGHEGETSTFQGTCQFSGTVRFDPPLTNTPRPVEGQARADGPCFGTFTDEDGETRVLDGDRVKYVASNSGPLTSCGSGVATGGGFLKYRGDRLEFRLTETRGAAVAVLALEGEEGGGATADARASEEEDPAEIAERCAGPGLRSAGVEIDLVSPSISG